MKALASPCYGVVQRSESRETQDGLSSIPWTEWLAFPDTLEWTRNPAEAHVFLGKIDQTGYEVACAFADRLNAEGHTTKHHACIRSQVRDPKEPPMPSRQARGLRPPGAARLPDWHERAPNCGVI